MLVLGLKQVNKQENKYVWHVVYEPGQHMWTPEQEVCPARTESKASSFVLLLP